jgi:diaminopimelate dehydrogenase
MTLAAVFTRRAPESLKISTEGVKVVHASDVEQYKNEIDVMIICGGSATDLPQQTPALARYFKVSIDFLVGLKDE